MTIVFMDVRGSSRLAQNMSPVEFSSAMQIFYNRAFPVVNDNDGFVTDVRGDGALVTFPPGFSGPDHAAKGIKAVREVLRVPMQTPDGSAISLGIGIHTGPVYIGTMTGREAGVEDVTVLGDNANLAAHLCSAAKPGEALVSEAARVAARLEDEGMETRHVLVKGREEPVRVSVLRAPAPP